MEIEEQQMTQSDILKEIANLPELTLTSSADV